MATRSNNRLSIEKESPSSVRFLYFDLPAPWLRLKKKMGLVKSYYIAWQAGLRFRFGRQRESYDLLHHITFNAFQVPGFWWMRRPMVILGPLGGGQTCPWRMLGFFRTQAPLELIRSLLVLLSSWNPTVLASFFFARAILIANRDTERRVPFWARKKIHRILETAIDLAHTAPLPEPGAGPIRFLQLGGLQKRKGGEITLRAFAQALEKGKDITLTFAGKGPDEAFLRHLTETLGLSDRVHFAGQISREALEGLFASHHALLFPSLRDTSGNVVLEAMAYGRPVIALRHQGVAEIATDETALLIDITSPAGVIRDTATAIHRLAASPELRRTLGAAGMKRVGAVFSWEAYGEKVARVYAEVAVAPPR